MDCLTIGDKANIKGLYKFGVNCPVNVFPQKRSFNVKISKNQDYDKSLVPIDVARLTRYIQHSDGSYYMCTETTQRRYNHYFKIVRRDVKIRIPNHFPNSPENSIPREKVSDPLVRGNNPTYLLVTKKYMGPFYTEYINLHSNDLGLKWTGVVTEQETIDQFYLFSYYQSGNAPVLDGVVAMSRFIFSKDEIQSFLFPGTVGYDLVLSTNPVPCPFPLRSLPMYIPSVKGALITHQKNWEGGSFHFPCSMMKFDIKGLEVAPWDECYLPMRQNWYSVHYTDTLDPVPCFRNANGNIYFMTNRHAPVILVMSIGCENNLNHFNKNYKPLWGYKLFVPRENILKYVDSASRTGLADQGPLHQFEQIVKKLVGKIGFIEVMSMFSFVFF